MNFFREKTLEFKIDCKALVILSGINSFFRMDPLWQDLLSLVKSIQDVEKRIHEEFEPQFRTHNYYAFNDFDVYECERDLPFYAQISESARRALAIRAENSSQSFLSIVRDGLVDDGFSLEVSDLTVYLLLQTCIGIPNRFLGIMQKLSNTLFNPADSGFDRTDFRKRLLQIFKGEDDVVTITMVEKIKLKNLSRNEIYSIEYVVQLQLEPGLKLSLRFASFCVCNHESIAAINRQLISRGFLGFNESAKIIFNLGYTEINALMKNNRDEAIKVFMRLLSIYSQPEREYYSSQLKEKRKGVIGLCLDLLDICIDCNYEFEIALFVLDKLLGLIENFEKTYIFDKQLVSPQLFALPRFTYDIIGSHQEQFMSYLESLAEYDITGENIDTIAVILVQLFMLHQKDLTDGVLKCLGCNLRLATNFVSKLEKSYQRKEEFLENLSLLRARLGNIDEYWWSRFLEEKIVSAEQYESMFAEQLQQVSAIEMLIRDIVTEVRRTVSVPDNVETNLSSQWNETIIDRLERGLRSCLKEQSIISSVFLWRLIFPFGLTTSARETLSSFVLEKINAFKLDMPFLSHSITYR